MAAAESAPGRVTGPGERVPLDLEEGDAEIVVRHGFSLHVSPLLVSAPGAARLCGLSERSWRKLDRTGRVPAALHVGRRRLWNVEELRRWTAAGCPPRERWETLRG